MWLFFESTRFLCESLICLKPNMCFIFYSRQDAMDTSLKPLLPFKGLRRNWKRTQLHRKGFSKIQRQWFLFAFSSDAWELLHLALADDCTFQYLKYYRINCTIDIWLFCMSISWNIIVFLFVSYLTYRPTCYNYWEINSNIIYIFLTFVQLENHPFYAYIYILKLMKITPHVHRMAP